MADIEYLQEDGIAFVTLNRPERRNALANDMRLQLAEAFQTADEDDSVRAVVLSGRGESFCTGADAGHMAPLDVKAARHRLQRNAHTLIRRLYRIEKPVIAAVRGNTLGIGLSMMLACDMVIASETARFSCIFARRGLAPDSGAVFFLSRLIGQARARELVYSTRFFDAAEAHSLGLLNRVVPDGELESAARELAEQMAAQPTYALVMAKQMFQMSLNPTLEQFLEYEALMQPQIHQTHDYREGIAAFREKRPAQFTGR